MFLARVYDFAQLRRRREIDSYYTACPKPLILDCGANIGASTIWFATQFPRSTVVAVEPEPGNFAVLQKNTGNANMIAVHGAVAGHAGELQLFDPGLGTAGFRTGSTGTTAGLGTVHAYTLDDLAAMVPGGVPFVLKIDIEGAEADLFKTHHRVLDNCPIVIIELHDWMLPGTASSREFLKWHASQDRDFVHIGENVYSLCNRLLPRAA
jgi:FkbM family methyltransferase